MHSERRTAVRSSAGVNRELSQPGTRGAGLNVDTKPGIMLLGSRSMVFAVAFELCGEKCLSAGRYDFLSSREPGGGRWYFLLSPAYQTVVWFQRTDRLYPLFVLSCVSPDYFVIPEELACKIHIRVW